MSIFSNKSQLYSEHIAAINETGDVLTYQDLGEFSARVSSLLEKRTLVCCLCENTIAAMSGYFAFVENEIVPIMVDGSIDKDLLENICTVYEPEYIWMSSDRSDLFASRDIVFSFDNYSLIRIGQKARFPLHDDLAVLLSTSGSTGSPKFVRVSYANLKANAGSIAEYLGIQSLDRPVTTLPMSYSYGLSIINSHLIQGATILLTTKSVIERDFWNFIKDQRATSLSGVPYTFEMLKKLRFFKMDLPHLKTLTQAGGKMHNELSQEFSHFCQDNGKKIFFMYGQTEATARMSYLAPNESISKLGSIGIAIPGGDFSLVDDEGHVVNQSNESGELVYKGKNVSMGYASGAQDLIKGDENYGILMTGDLALRDDDGFYYIIGRKSRFIKIYGNRVNLDEAEQLIKNITGDVACVGSDEKMIIYITDESLVSEVRSFIATKTGINFRAFEVRVIANIPKSSSGKLIYRDLQT
jgi:acyl-coenzyme A synthetase/AMP-(fatty) acid ligase